MTVQVGSMPRVSLVVPMANERAYIQGCIDGLVAQDYPHDRLEILVVDGGSVDGSRAIVEGAAAGHPGLFRILDNPRRITPVAFNIGIREATGELIGIVSGHSVLAPDYVLRCVEYLDRTGADHVGGLMTAVGLTPLACAIAESTNSPSQSAGHGFITTRASSTSSPCTWVCTGAMCSSELAC